MAKQKSAAGATTPQTTPKATGTPHGAGASEREGRQPPSKAKPRATTDEPPFTIQLNPDVEALVAAAREEEAKLVLVLRADLTNTGKDHASLSIKDMEDEAIASLNSHLAEPRTNIGPSDLLGHGDVRITRKRCPNKSTTFYIIKVFCSQVEADLIFKPAIMRTGGLPMRMGRAREGSAMLAPTAEAPHLAQHIISFTPSRPETWSAQSVALLMGQLGASSIGWIALARGSTDAPPVSSPRDSKVWRSDLLNAAPDLPAIHPADEDRYIILLDGFHDFLNERAGRAIPITGGDGSPHGAVTFRRISVALGPAEPKPKAQQAPTSEQPPPSQANAHAAPVQGAVASVDDATAAAASAAAATAADASAAAAMPAGDNNALAGATPMLVEPANITSKRRPGLTPLEDAALILQDIAASPTGAGGQPLKEPG
jgi:hypothetical protein